MTRNEILQGSVLGRILLVILLRPFVFAGLAAMELHQLLRQLCRNIYRLLRNVGFPSLFSARLGCLRALAWSCCLRTAL